MTNIYIGSNCESEAKGLRTAKFDSQTGLLEETSCVENAINPIFMARIKKSNLLYVSESVAAFNVGDESLPGGVSVFKNTDGTLTRLASYALAPTVPCHISISPDGKYLAWAEYRKGNVGVMAIDPETGLLTPIRSRKHEGACGPNAERQEAPHCHFAAWNPAGTRLFVCDLGMDRVFAYSPLLEEEIASESFVAPPGAGPRHLAFLPNSNIAFLVTELSNEVFALRMTCNGSSPEIIDCNTLLPSDFSDFSKAAAIKLSPDNRWLLVSNRGHNSIAAFRVNTATGKLTPGPISLLDGEFPRDFTFSRDGRHLIVGHKMSNEVAVYAFDPESGALSVTDSPRLKMTKPLCFIV